MLRNANGPGTRLAVRLRDTDVNGSGIGARLAFRFGGRPTQTVEIAARGNRPGSPPPVA